jgi:hypothetical protein
MKVLKGRWMCTRSRLPDTLTRKIPIKKGMLKLFFHAENVLYSFDQSMCNRYKRVTGIIEYLDIIQRF